MAVKVMNCLSRFFLLDSFYYLINDKEVKRKEISSAFMEGFSLAAKSWELEHIMINLLLVCLLHMDTNVRRIT